MIGIIGISGKMGSYIASLFTFDNIIGLDKISSDKYNTVIDEEVFLNYDLDVIVDFSSSEFAELILKKALNKGIKVITGTSSISNLDELRQIAFEKKVSFVYLQNFSQGINEVINFIDEIKYDECEIIEEHFILKKDISQTAKCIADKINTKNISSVRTIKKQSNHYIKFYLDGEEIQITHKCYNYNAYKKVFLEQYDKIIKSEFYIKCGI